MLTKRNRTAVPVFRALVLTGCFAAACAVGENAAFDSAAAGSGQSSAGSAGSGTSGAAHAGATGTAGAGAGGAPSTADDGGDGGSAADGSVSGDAGNGGSAMGGAGNGGAGNGGSAMGGAGNGGSAMGGAGNGGAGNGGAGNGGTGGTAGTGGGTIANIDLSTFQPASAGTYNGTSHTLTIVAQLYCQFPLPKTFMTGQSVAVHVTGTNNGTGGLRSWLVDGSQATLSNMVSTYVGAGLPAGSFTLDYTLTATNSAGLLFYKGPTFDTNIDNVVISSITVSY